MYHQIATRAEVKWNSSKVIPLRTWQQQSSVINLVEDDRCFVFLQEDSELTLRWIPKEIIGSLSDLHTEENPLNEVVAPTPYADL